MSSHLSEIYNQYFIPTYRRMELDLARGSGCHVWDFDGRRYLDFGAGIAVCSLGHAHPEVSDAVCNQARTLVHVSNLYRTQPQADLAVKLAGLVGAPGKIFFCNSGAEANEGLIKLTRKFGSATGRYEIITFHGSFHGRTMAGISATAQDKIKAGFAPLVEGFVHLPLNDLDAVRAAIGPKTAAILVEPIQGEGGINRATPEFLRGLREICNEKSLLLMFDEIQVGLGRTGCWNGWQAIAPDITPDAISWAKGIANGFPLGAFWVANRTVGPGPLSDVLSAGSHGTTFGGNPVCCAAALSVLTIIERDNLLANAVACGDWLQENIRALNSPMLSDVRGIGLMIGLELAPGGFDAGTGIRSRVFAEKLNQAGLLLIPAGENVIRLLPPLNVSQTDLNEALNILKTVLLP